MPSSHSSKKKPPEFLDGLKGPLSTRGSDTRRIASDALFNIDYAIRYLQDSSALYSLRPVLEGNTAKAESHYFRANRMVGCFEDLLA